VAQFAFSDDQRHHVERLLDDWERELAGRGGAPSR
jgi:hypothetical protein